MEGSQGKTEEFLGLRYTKDINICMKTVGELDQRISQLEQTVEEYQNNIRQFSLFSLL